MDKGSQPNYRPTKDSRIVVATVGGFTGGLMGKADVVLSKLNNDDFTRVSEILELLQTPNAPPERNPMIGDFGDIVMAGDPTAHPNEMQPIFLGGPFSETPLVVEELRTILGKYVGKSPTANNERGIAGRG